MCICLYWCLIMCIYTPTWILKLCPTLRELKPIRVAGGNKSAWARHPNADDLDRPEDDFSWYQKSNPESLTPQPTNPVSRRIIKSKPFSYIGLVLNSGLWRLFFRHDGKPDGALFRRCPVENQSPELPSAASHDPQPFWCSCPATGEGCPALLASISKSWQKTSWRPRRKWWSR